MPNSSFCPYPFLDPTPFSVSLGCECPLFTAAPLTSEDVPGRFCGSVEGSTCCLPCPLQGWVFDDAFMGRLRGIQRYVSPLSLAACLFLLLSWTVLPAEKSHRHYLSVGLIVFVLFVAVSAEVVGNMR
jgi:hypothetical protein